MQIYIRIYLFLIVKYPTHVFRLSIAWAVKDIAPGDNLNHWPQKLELTSDYLYFSFRSLVLEFLITQTMAESFIFSIAESLITKLASHAFQEASRVVGLYDHLRDLKKTLSLVKAVLLDAEQKQEHNHELQEWLRQLKSVFYDAEDVLDEFECQTLRKQVLKAHGTIKDEVSHFFSSSNPLVFRSKMVPWALSSCFRSVWHSNSSNTSSAS